MERTLNEIKRSLEMGLFGMTKKEAIAKQICIDCKAEIGPRLRDDAEQREYLISGLCGPCWERTVKPFVEEL